VQEHHQLVIHIRSIVAAPAAVLGHGIELPGASVPAGDARQVYGDVFDENVVRVWVKQVEQDAGVGYHPALLVEGFTD